MKEVSKSMFLKLNGRCVVELIYGGSIGSHLGRLVMREFSFIFSLKFFIVTSCNMADYSQTT